MDVSTPHGRVLTNQKGSEWMELDERKTKILEAIIRNYLETGEPVGSRTISKFTDLNLSSATIRNEMSDLEENETDAPENVGEAVLTSTVIAQNFSAQAKLNREQMRSKNKEALIERHMLCEIVKA